MKHLVDNNANWPDIGGLALGKAKQHFWSPIEHASFIFLAAISKLPSYNNLNVVLEAGDNHLAGFEAEQFTANFY